MCDFSPKPHSLFVCSTKLICLFMVGRKKEAKIKRQDWGPKHKQNILINPSPIAQNFG